MRLSTKSRYAVTSMLNLAIHDQLDTVTLADIAQMQGISLSYLEQLFAKLRKRHLVEGVRGPGGGYRLAKPLSEISVVQIITAVDEPESGYKHSGEGLNTQANLTRELWEDLNERLYEFLDGITLANLIEQPKARKMFNRLNKQDELAKRSAA
jgi:Rrf2 family iron-sulfur cluster assembly transcriptional regulator